MHKKKAAAFCAPALSAVPTAASMTFALYRLLTYIAAWPLRVVLRWRSWRGKEDPARLAERRGLSPLPRPEGRLIWCHAASVGESVGLLPLIDRICSSPKTHVLLTSGTTTSAQIMAQRLPDGATHQFAPWDRRAWVSSFLEHWQPDLAIRMESELWPNTQLLMHERHIPVAVINARLSAGSARGWSRFGAMAKTVFGSIDLVVAQSATFAAAFEHLGARHVKVAPNLKLSANALPVDREALTVLQGSIGARPVWLAASTHDGEEQIAMDVHRSVSKDVPELLTIIVPRHPDRGGDIRQLAAGSGLPVSLRSTNDSIDAETDIYVADTLGELGLFYTVSRVVFMGKSLTATGGQNPVEAAHFECAILFGIHMENFEDIAETMLAAGMAEQVDSQETLENAVRSLLMNDLRRDVLSASASSMVKSGPDGLDQTYGALLTLMDGSDGNGR